MSLSKLYFLLFFLSVLGSGHLFAQEPQLEDTTRACFSDSVFLDAGPGFLSYLWNTDEQTQTIWAKSHGQYTVTCTNDTLGFTLDTTWAAFQNAHIQQEDTIITCYKYPVILSVEPDTLQYFWTSNDPDLVIENDTAFFVEVVPELDTTTIYVAITDSANTITCTDSVRIWLYPRMIFKEVNQINTGCPGTCKGQLQVIVEGGFPPYSYLWPNTTPRQRDSIAFGLCEAEYTIEVTDDTLCIRDTAIFVEVYDMPEVNILYDPEEIFIENPVVNFSSENLTEDSIQISYPTWNFGDSTYSTENEPVKVFDMVRDYEVWLKYTTSDECIDSVSQTVVVKHDDVVIYNVFTPNGDEHNQYFTIDKLENYMSSDLKIFNRYGKMVYHKENYESDTWDGDNLMEGPYFYVLKAVGYFGTDVFRGSVTIIRNK
nr:gliding motility-associated C-terminal domain-containing protein [Bacteroidota bacterium]